jgi:hypothetical protein
MYQNMQITTLTLAVSLRFVSSEIALVLQAEYPAPEAREVLEDWQVFNVSSLTPFNWPQFPPWADIIANVIDPNALNLGNASSDSSSQGFVSLAHFLCPKVSRIPPVSA